MVITSAAGQVEATGKRIVILTIASEQGDCSSSYILSPADARNIAEGLTRMAEQAESRIVKPGQPTLLPHPSLQQN